MEVKDEMKIMTPMLKGFIASAIEKIVRKKFGYGMAIDINDIYISMDDEGAHVHLNAGLDVDKKSIERILSEVI